MDFMLQIDEAFEPHLEPNRLEQALVSALTVVPALAPTSAQTVTIVITDNELVQQLNRDYRGVDAPTDVLSFENLPDPDFPDVGQAGSDHLGDIIIAYPVAKAQALAAGHTPPEEVILLAIHGLLHLLGFDHDTPESKERMWAVQRQMMTHLGLAHVQPTET
jgi:probable rRNA maturation factor